MIETLLDPNAASDVATLADQAAAQNWLSNRIAFENSQPRLIEAVDSIACGLEWVFGRDGALTGIDADGRWWGGCSLPAQAAKFMFLKADLSGTVLCFLDPTHAAQIRFALDRMLPSQALIVLTPALGTLRVLLACEDFSADVSAHRLFFAWGDDWADELSQLLDENPGLPTPTQFLRPILADQGANDAMVHAAQEVFSDCFARRTDEVRALRARWHRRSTLKKICLVAPSQFRLWDDTGAALADALGSDIDGIRVCRFDSDAPTSSSPLALAQAVAGCDAVITPNLGRTDLPDLMPDGIPWITWLTGPRIPRAPAIGDHDTLFITDPSWRNLAMEKGWDTNHVVNAGWPLESADAGSDWPVAKSGTAKHPGQLCIAIISDTCPINPPARAKEYSSHRLLWEAIEHELLNDPFALRESPDAYLTARLGQAKIEEDGFDRQSFLEGVILHAYQQGIARLLLQEEIPFMAFGNGWEQIDAFMDYAAGPISSRQHLYRAINSATALAHVWPTPFAHPIESFGKTVVRGGRRKDSFLQDVRLALAGKHPSPSHRAEPLNADLVSRALRGL